jgi:hypothetical protein
VWGANGILTGPGVSFEIPVFNRNQGLIARAEAEIQIASRQYLALKQRVALEVAEAREQLVQAQDALRRLRDDVIPPLQRAISLAEEQYKSGDVSFLLSWSKPAGSWMRRFDSSTQRRPFASLRRSWNGAWDQMNATVRGWLAVAGACLLLQSCSHTAESAPKAKQQAPAKVENRVTEANLTKITLSPEAEQRLGIQLTDVVETQVSDVSQISGEILLIPGKALTVTAPVAGMVHFARPNLAVGQTVRNAEQLFRLTPVLSPQRDLRITYEADVQSAKARLDAAAQQLERARVLLKELAGSQKNVEAAEQEFRQAKAAHEAAVNRLERLKTHPLDGDVDMPIPAPTSGIVRQIQSLRESNGGIRSTAA